MSVRGSKMLTIDSMELDSIRSREEHTVARSSWVMTASILTGEIMGTGVLGLPHACANLGWFLGIAACLLFGCTAIYSGFLLSRVREDYDAVTSYADLALSLGGKVFAAFTRAAIILTWALLLPYYMIVCVDSLLLAAPDAVLCFWHWTLVVAALLIVPLQLRSLHLISFLSAASTAAMVVTVIVLLVQLLQLTTGTDGGSGELDDATSLWPRAGASFLDIYSNTGSFIVRGQPALHSGAGCMRRAWPCAAPLSHPCPTHVPPMSHPCGQPPTRSPVRGGSLPIKDKACSSRLCAR